MSVQYNSTFLHTNSTPIKCSNWFAYNNLSLYSYDVLEELCMSLDIIRNVVSYDSSSKTSRNPKIVLDNKMDRCRDALFY